MHLSPTSKLGYLFFNFRPAYGGGGGRLQSCSISPKVDKVRVEENYDGPIYVIAYLIL